MLTSMYEKSPYNVYEIKLYEEEPDPNYGHRYAGTVHVAARNTEIAEHLAIIELAERKGNLPDGNYARSLFATSIVAIVVNVVVGVTE